MYTIKLITKPPVIAIKSTNPNIFLKSQCFFILMTYLLVFPIFFPKPHGGFSTWVLQALRDQQLADPLHQALATLLRRCGGSLPRLLVCGLEWLTFTWKDGNFQGKMMMVSGWVYIYNDE